MSPKFVILAFAVCAAVNVWCLWATHDIGKTIRWQREIIVKLTETVNTSASALDGSNKLLWKAATQAGAIPDGAKQPPSK